MYNKQTQNHVSLYFQGQTTSLKKYVQERISKWWSNKCSKESIFTTNISLLRPFLSLSLTPVSFSADIKRSIPEIKATFLSHVTDGIYRRYILLIYVIYRLKCAPPSTLYCAFISACHICHLLNNPYTFLFKFTRLWFILSHFPFLTFLGAVVNIHTTKFRIKSYTFSPHIAFISSV
jgi:hypothetical protein